MANKIRRKKRLKVHTKKWDRLVRKLRKEGKVKSPEAVATATLGPKSFLKQPRRKK